MNYKWHRENPCFLWLVLGNGGVKWKIWEVGVFGFGTGVSKTFKVKRCACVFEV